ncbi:4Fe-4S cluster-binding domain-containing protein, partial [bacterium]|nr:4Fe-4S cluster-binding domain-containing protein [bacterium]
VTILGGEPFDQYSELVNLISRIKKIGLSLIVYTGYTLKNLYEKQYNNVLSEIDILIANPYDGKQRNTTLQWIGSENQEIYFLSNRYNQSEIEDGTYVEVLIDEFGKMTRLGFPDDF